MKITKSTWKPVEPAVNFSFRFNFFVTYLLPYKGNCNSILEFMTAIARFLSLAAVLHTFKASSGFGDVDLKIILELRDLQRLKPQVIFVVDFLEITECQINLSKMMSSRGIITLVLNYTTLSEYLNRNIFPCVSTFIVIKSCALNKLRPVNISSYGRFRILNTDHIFCSIFRI